MSLSAEDRELVLEFIELLQSRPPLPPGMPAERRRDDAIEQMILMLDVARRACGERIVREAYGASGSDRSSALQQFAIRAQLASYAFGELDRGPGSLNEAQSEARAIAQGDIPRAFAKTGQRKKAVRLLQAKFLALRWDAWLDGFGVSTAERHGAIGLAFGAEWATIARRWIEDIKSVWGESALQQLEQDTRDASRNLRMDVMRRGEIWQVALARAGNRYIRELRQR